MIIQIEKPQLTHADIRKDMELLDTWAGSITDQLNYILNHIDTDNLSENLRESLGGK